MTEDQLYGELKNYVENDKNSFDEILIRFKDQGGSQQDAYRICEQLRKHYEETEILEDKILDVMDVVSGYCSPHYKIWD